jgi:L-rhamnose isomerase
MLVKDQQVLFCFRGVPVVQVTGARIRQEDRQEGFYYYDIRHSDDDWGYPCTVEPYVLINHFGTIVTTQPIEFEPDENGDAYLEITDEERELIWEYCR